MTLEVIGPRGHELQIAIASATDIDEVLELHEKFLDSCLKECLLASQDLLKVLTKIMTTCLLFADYMKKLTPAYPPPVGRQTSTSRDRRKEQVPIIID